MEAKRTGSLPTQQEATGSFDYIVHSTHIRHTQKRSVGVCLQRPFAQA